MKKILITGATSMLGLALIKKSIEQEIEVIALHRAGSVKTSLIPNHRLVKTFQCDLSEIENFHNSFDGIDCLFHLGWANTDKQNRDNPTLQEKNIKYTLDAVELAKRLGCKKFIGAGSQAEYGRVEGKITSSHAPNPDISYGAAKYAAGVLSRIMCSQYNISHNWVRIFSVYGPNDGAETLISYAIKSMLNNEDCNFTKCEQLWDYLHCDDCAEALYLIGKKGKSNAIYNIGSGKAEQLKKYIETIKLLTNSNSKINYGVIPYSNVQIMHLEADITDLTFDTGFVPAITIEKGIGKLIEVYTKERGEEES